MAKEKGLFCQTIFEVRHHELGQSGCLTPKTPCAACFAFASNHDDEPQRTSSKGADHGRKYTPVQESPLAKEIAT